MDMIGKIRRMHRRDKKTQREISRKLGLSRNTVAKWLDEAQPVEPKYRREAAKATKLSAYEAELKQALKALWLVTERPVLGLGALHALSMGFLGSIMMAMVTRVSCGHSGRALVADDLVWGLFWALQAVVGLRLVAAVEGVPLWLTMLAALGWATVITVWGLRYTNWYGRPRLDGKPG